MRTIIIFAFLIGLLGQDQLQDAKSLGEKGTVPFAIAQQTRGAVSAVQIEGEDVVDKAEAAVDLRGESEPATEVNQDVFSLNTVNGLTLYDSREDVKAKLGDPDSIEQDQYLKDAVTYHYGDTSISFYQEYIQSVDFAVTVKELNIDGVIVQADAEALKAALGKPDYVAEDGIVFQRHECLLKVFFDAQTGERHGISYYHMASV